LQSELKGLAEQKKENIRQIEAAIKESMRLETIVEAMKRQIQIEIAKATDAAEKNVVQNRGISPI